MHKNISLLTLAVFSAFLLAAPSALSKPKVLSQNTPQGITQEVEQTVQKQEIITFFENLARKNPAQFATFLLERKLAYVANEHLIYIGIKGTHEVLVICQIDDFEVGTFYHFAHKIPNGRIMEESVGMPPSTQGYTTLYQRVK